MPASSQVECECNRALSSPESVLVRGAHASECLAEPEEEEVFPQKQTHRSAWSGLLKIVCFFALIVLLLFGLNAMINSGLRHVKTSQFGVSNKIVQGKINAEIVISGSSRALTHYDPRIIERITGYSTFNIGLNGSQTDLQLARLKAYLKHNQKPKLLVQNLDLFSFLTSHEIYDPAQYVPYLNEGSIYAGVRRVYPDAWKWKYLPLYGYAVEDMRFNWMIGLKALAGIQPKEDHVNGYRPRDTSWTGDFEKFRANNPDGVVVETEAQGVRDFEELLGLCAEQGIPVLIVYSPEYYEMQAIERNRKELLGKAKEMTGHFNFPLWDYSESPICRDRSNFYNSQHLNKRGASLFSEEFAGRLVGTAPVKAIRASHEQRGAAAPVSAFGASIFAGLTVGGD
jgi:hypothetical protein